MRINRWGLLLSVMFLALAAFPNNLSAQQQYGQLQIQVVDQTQAVMPGAPVELTSPALIRPITGTAYGRSMFSVENQHVSSKGNEFDFQIT